jgi:hypothetical protein
MILLDRPAGLQIGLQSSADVNWSGAGVRPAEGVRLPCTPPLGALAQLGERLHGMQEVGGSIPPGSTNPDISRTGVAGTRKTG